MPRRTWQVIVISLIASACSDAGETRDAEDGTTDPGIDLSMDAGVSPVPDSTDCFEPESSDSPWLPWHIYPEGPGCTDGRLCDTDADCVEGFWCRDLLVWEGLSGFCGEDGCDQTDRACWSAPPPVPCQTDDSCGADERCTAGFEECLPPPPDCADCDVLGCWGRCAPAPGLLCSDGSEPDPVYIDPRPCRDGNIYTVIAGVPQCVTDPDTSVVPCSSDDPCWAGGESERQLEECVGGESCAVIVHVDGVTFQPISYGYTAHTDDTLRVQDAVLNACELVPGADADCGNAITEPAGGDPFAWRVTPEGGATYVVAVSGTPERSALFLAEEGQDTFRVPLAVTPVPQFPPGCADLTNPVTYSAADNLPNPIPTEVAEAIVVSLDGFGALLFVLQGEDFTVMPFDSGRDDGLTDWIVIARR